MGAFSGLGTVVGIDVAIPVAERRHQAIWLVSAIAEKMFAGRKRDNLTRMREVWGMIQSMHLEIWPAVQMTPLIRLQMHTRGPQFLQTLGEVQFGFYLFRLDTYRNQEPKKGETLSGPGGGCIPRPIKSKNPEPPLITPPLL